MQPHWPLCIKINICWVDLTGITGALLGWKSHHYSIPFTAGSTLSSSSTRFTNRAAFLFMSSDRRWKRWQSSRCSSSPLRKNCTKLFHLFNSSPVPAAEGVSGNWDEPDVWCIDLCTFSHCSHIAWGPKIFLMGTQFWVMSGTRLSHIVCPFESQNICA